MRISKKQAELLAEEVANKLQAKQKFKVAESVIKKVNDFKSKRDDLVRQKDAIQKKIDALDYGFSELFDNTSAYPYWTAERIIETLKNGKKPNVSKIADKIVLKAMFNSSENLEEFIDGLVKDFSKNPKEYVI